MSLRKAFIITGETPETRRQKGEQIIRDNPGLICNAYEDTGFSDQYALIFGDNSADFSYVDGNALLFAATFEQQRRMNTACEQENMPVVLPAPFRIKGFH